MQLPAQATSRQRFLKLRKGHRSLGLDQAVARSILADIKVGTEVVHLDVPYRIAAYAAKAGWSAVFGKSERIVRSD
jgi:hypothetical protein